VLEDIEDAKSEDDLAALRAVIKTLQGAERQLAIQAGMAKQNALRSAPIDVPAVPAAPPVDDEEVF
jgi:hypothetical protein